ncbi:MAG: glycosyltransferase family 4 protein [Alphaproteobacteria bacterium]|nr:glycosyltransferase family 4 protein [Alphaproteobacteria bacterium]
MTIEKTGNFQGHAWEQIDLFWAARRHTLLNFCNSGAILHSRQFVMIHDACVYRHPEFFGKNYRLLHQTLGKLLAKNSLIGTVSKFSRCELATLLNIPPQSIGVFYNGLDHMSRVQPEPAIIQKHSLQNTPYFLCIGSLSKNKNVQVAIDAITQLDHKNLRLVVVGGGNKNIFGNQNQKDTDTVIFTGRLSDEEIAALLQHAKAFVFPSIYEGFGLPPLEAMVMGCPVLATTADAVMEVCAEYARYFDANDASALANLMQQTLNTANEQTEKQKAYLATFTWEQSARSIAHFIIEKGLI